MATTVQLGATERASELYDLVHALAAVRDPAGMLSLTVGIEPGAVGGGTRPWEIALDNDLSALQHGPHGSQALARRLAELAPRVAALVDPVGFGRGHALYAPLGPGPVTEVAVQGVLPTAARIGPVAHVLPLLAVLEQGLPAGLLCASRDEIVVLEAELGLVHDLARIELEPTITEWPEMKGAVRANPLRGAHTVSQRDLFERRLAAAYRHTLDEAVRAARALAAERGWSRTVLAGDPRLTHPLEVELTRAHVAVAVLRANLEGLRPDDAVHRLEAALAALVGDHALALARRASEGAVAGGAGACGLAPVLDALGQGRVEHLLIDPTGSYRGVVGEDELLAPAGEGGGIDLADLIVSRALATGAAVLPLTGDAAQVPTDGIGALLRW